MGDAFQLSLQAKVEHCFYRYMWKACVYIT